jgi:hypothetical protein
MIKLKPDVNDSIANSFEQVVYDVNLKPVGYVNKKRKKYMNYSKGFGRVDYANAFESLNLISTFSGYRMLVFVIWLSKYDMVDDIIHINLSNMRRYCGEQKIPEFTRPSFGRGLKELINADIVKPIDPKNKDLYKLNFHVLANGNYYQETF